MSDPLLRAPILQALPGVEHGFETRHGGLAAASPAPLLRLRQVHGHDVHTVTPETDLAPFRTPDVDRLPAGDALVTARPGCTVAVATADCLPVLVAAEDGRAVAAAHAGWRGLALGILPATLGVLAREHGVLPGAVVVAVGPAVGPCCYRVGDDVRTAFAAAGLAEGTFGAPREEGNEGGTTWSCDLVHAARSQLRQGGVEEARIAVIDRCTRCDAEAFHSYRRDGDAAGRQLSGIAIGS